MEHTNLDLLTQFISKFATVEKLKAGFSSVSPSSERIRSEKKRGEGCRTANARNFVSFQFLLRLIR